MMNAGYLINELVSYALQKGLVEVSDEIYVRNTLLAIMGLDDHETAEGKTINSSSDDSHEDSKQGTKCERELCEILNDLIADALERGVLESDDIVSRDLFDTKLMGALVERPSRITAIFNEKYKQDKVAATDWFYEFCGDVNYIRRDRIRRDRKWKVDSSYGEIDITINLSKPEKDPKAIAAAKSMKQSGYPKCQLCRENEGYAGRMNHPARQNHRIIPIQVCGDPWGFQYSPYVYYNEHCIVFNAEHTPMKIERKTFEKLFSFVEQFPHYFLGSNADLPIVGGSILTHDHFQGGHYTFAMERAPIENTFVVKNYEDVKAGIVHWPLSVIRLQGENPDRVIDLADYILQNWRGYTDEAACVYAQTDGEPHNTITPIARKKGAIYELDLALRNNLTTKEHPLGLYHPHEVYHHIKKENIGLIEVMGLAVLPARLEKEMACLKECLLEKKPLETYEELHKHVEWVNSWINQYDLSGGDAIDKAIEQEIGKVFVGVLEDAGVYKCTAEGRAAFRRFLDDLTLL